MKIKSALLRWLPLVVIGVLLMVAFVLRLDRYVSFATLQQYHTQLLQWTNQYFWLTALVFVAIYIIAVAISLPGAIFLTITSGFLFGLVMGTVFAVVGASIGALLLFIAVRSSFGHLIAEKAKGWVAKFEVGFQKNSFNYLLTLRLIPIFPFWLVNIVSALFNMRLLSFLLATVLGVIPGSFVYVTVGHGLGHILAQGQTPKLDVIFSLPILLPLLGLALLSLLPIIYKALRRKT